MSCLRLCSAWVVILAFSALVRVSVALPSFTSELLPPQSADQFAATLVAAKTAEERAALLDAHPKWLTAQLGERLVNQGRSFAEQSNYPAALDALQLARTVAERINDPKSVVAALSGTGNVQLARGDLKAALDLFQQAQRLAEASG